MNSTEVSRIIHILVAQNFVFFFFFFSIHINHAVKLKINLLQILTGDGSKKI